MSNSCCCVHSDRRMCIAWRTSRTYDDVATCDDECMCYCHDEEEESDESDQETTTITTHTTTTQTYPYSRHNTVRDR